MRKTAIGKAEQRCQRSLLCFNKSSAVWHTVTKNEFGNSREVHRNTTKKVIVATESYQTLRSDGTLKAAQDKDGGCVWDQEANETEQRRVS